MQKMHQYLSIQNVFCVSKVISGGYFLLSEFETKSELIAFIDFVVI
jgi:hypothetical protein